MATRVLEQEEMELTDEGKQLWNLITQYDVIMSKSDATPVDKKRRVRLNIYEVELLAVRLELKRMIVNSERVIADCDKIIATYKTKQEYLASDAKVARMVHINLIDRLQRILDGKEAFDFEIKVPKEEKAEPNKFYREPGSKK